MDWGSWRFSEESLEILKELINSYKSTQDYILPVDQEINEFANSETSKKVVDQICTPAANKNTDKPDDSDTKYIPNEELTEEAIEEIVSCIICYLNSGKKDEVKTVMNKCDKIYYRKILEIVIEKIQDVIARSVFCSALIDDYNPDLSLITELILNSWAENCGKSVTLFMENLVEIIGKFPDRICDEVILSLLNSPKSILVIDQQLFSDIIHEIPSQFRSHLLRTYINSVQYPVEKWKLPILLTLIENSVSLLQDDVEILKSIIRLCSNCSSQYDSDRNFANILISIATIVPADLKSEIKNIAMQIKGLMKHRILKSLNI